MSKLNNLIDNINRKGKTQREWMTASEEGEYIIRICRDIEDLEEAPFEEFYLHSGFIHPFYGKKSAIKCLGRHCPMCDYAKEYAEKDPRGAWQFKSKQYYVYNVIDRSDGHLKLLKVTWAAHNQIVAKIIEAAQQGINIMDFERGRDLQITVRKVSNKLVYKGYILSERETQAVKGKLQEEIKFVKPLREAYRSYTKDELTAIVDGKVPTQDMKTKAKSNSKASLIENLQKRVRESQSNMQQQVPATNIKKEEPVVTKAAAKPTTSDSLMENFNDIFEDDDNE